MRFETIYLDHRQAMLNVVALVDLLTPYCPALSPRRWDSDQCRLRRRVPTRPHLAASGASRASVLPFSRHCQPNPAIVASTSWPCALGQLRPPSHGSGSHRAAIAQTLLPMVQAARDRAHHHSMRMGPVSMSGR